jgi:hypothetical protein
MSEERAQLLGEVWDALDSVERLLAELQRSTDRLDRQGVAELMAREIEDVRRLVGQLGRGE